ncbi:hypothetical protein BJ170DRAFT_393618 [Xylariales sp. AK1849]|nr:hypothetical protein BJ170DRAFT_393618 [Xylariales sp. AK1849]
MSATLNDNANGRWVLDLAQEGLSSLHYDTAVSPPTAADLGPEDVLVEMRAASLNYRDLVITRGNPQSANPVPVPETGIVPGSDGSGVISAIGRDVPQLSPGLRSGTKVITHMVPHVPSSQLPTWVQVCSGLGQQTKGTLCRRGVFHYSAVVEMGGTMSFEEGATLTCSGLTAWNALMGMRGRQVEEGDWVLVQGTGGVSVASLQITVAVGANVIATTSSDAKAERLRALGARYVLNYRTGPNWGTDARNLTPDGRGVDHVVDVGGQLTLAESMNAVRLDGLITLTGMVAGVSDVPGPEAMSALSRLYVMRGIMLGTRNMMKEMIAWFEEKGLKPAVDDAVYELEDAIKAYEKLESQKHFSKVIIRIL